MKELNTEENMGKMNMMENKDEDIKQVIEQVSSENTVDSDEMRDAAAIVQMSEHNPLPAVKKAKITSPINEVEESLVKFTTDMFDVARRDNVFREAMQNEILSRLTEMTNDQVLTLYNSDSVNRNDHVSKLLQPTFGLISKQKEAETIANKDERVQIINQLGGQCSDKAMRSLNEESPQEVLQGLSQMSLLLDAFSKLKQSGS